MQSSHLRDTAELCAFLYAGALQHPTRSKDYEDWNGHTGFVSFCADCADLISAYLNQPERSDDIYPGVIYYELIEPLGEWAICEDASLTAHLVLERFREHYRAWIKAPRK